MRCAAVVLVRSCEIYLVPNRLRLRSLRFCRRWCWFCSVKFCQRRERHRVFYRPLRSINAHAHAVPAREPHERRQQIIQQQLLLYRLGQLPQRTLVVIMQPPPPFCCISRPPPSPCCRSFPLKPGSVGDAVAAGGV